MGRGANSVILLAVKATLPPKRRCGFFVSVQKIAYGCTVHFAIAAPADLRKLAEWLMMYDERMEGMQQRNSPQERTEPSARRRRGRR